MERCNNVCSRISGNLYPRAGIQPTTNRFVQTPTTPTLGHGSPPPRARTQPVTDRFVETPTMPTPGHGSPLPKHSRSPVATRFVETLTLPNPGLNRPSWRTERQPGAEVRDSPVQTGPVAGAFMKGPKLCWDRKGDDRPDDTLDSGMGTLQSRGAGPVRYWSPCCWTLL